jgi:hypothetical protein
MNAIAVWAIVRETGTYIVGEVHHLAPNYRMHPPTAVWLKNPVIMVKVGREVTFQEIDVVDGDLLVNIREQLGAGELRQPFRSLYEMYVDSLKKEG